jgi:hypothetical protein
MIYRSPATTFAHLNGQKEFSIAFNFMLELDGMRFHCLVISVK